MTEFAPFAPPPDAGPGAPGTVGDLYRIFGTDRKRDDAPAVAPATKLVVRKHDFSSAQTAYQRARSAPSSQLIFYKDATPRGEHYIRCAVACEPARPDVVPLRLALCYEDGTDVSPQDASCLKILGEATHLSCPPHAKETTFYYRLELGSFRRADRKFRVRVTGAGVAHCLTPPLLVLSKTKPLDASAPLSPPTELPDGLRRGQRPAGRKRTRPCGKLSPPRRHRRSMAWRVALRGGSSPREYRVHAPDPHRLISTQALGRPSAPSIPPPSRSGAQSTSRSSRSIADSRISRDRSPILRCGSALLSPCRRRRGPNLLIMFLIYCSRPSRKFTILVFQNTMPACQNSHIGLPALRKFRSRGG